MNGKDARHIALIAGTSIVSLALCLWFFNNGIFIIVQNLLYVPIIIACIYYSKRGFIFTLLLSLIYFFLLAYFAHNHTLIQGGAVRCGIFLLIGATVSVLSLRIQNRDKEIIEKEMLLREIHHRVKNNMAQIQSLLLLQAGTTSSNEAKDALQEAVARIQTMSVLYEKLLLSQDCQSLQIKAYVEDLLHSIAVVLNQNGKISIHTDITDFTIDVKTANTIGIIINELITNAFKHAFKDRSEGSIMVIINKVKDTVELTIQDDGKGYVTDSRADTPAGMGKTIVKMLTEKLNGTYSVTNEAGIRNSIRFKT